MAFLSDFLLTLRAQSDTPTYTKLEWLFYQIFLLTLCAQSDTPTYTKLEWLFYRTFCSHSVHKVTLRRIQNLNGFSIGFFCSHSAHNVTLRCIHRLPTTVGLAQACPKYFMQLFAPTNMHGVDITQLIQSMGTLILVAKLTI